MAVGFIRRVPVLGSLLSLPGISAVSKLSNIFNPPEGNIFCVSMHCCEFARNTGECKQRGYLCYYLKICHVGNNY